MKNSKKTATYLPFILGRAWNKTINFLDVKNVIMGFLISGLGSFVYQYYFQNKKYALEASLISIVIIFILLFVLTFVAFAVREPELVYYEQSAELIEKEDFINPEVVLDLLPSTPNPNPEGDSWVGVKIINRSGARSIENCKVKLYGIKSLPGTNAIIDNQELPSDLKWSDNNKPDSNGFLTLQREDQAFLDIARSREHFQAGNFVLSRGDNFLYFPSGDYLITFKINGKIRVFSDKTEKLVDIHPQQYSARIILQAGYNLRIEEIKKI